MRISDWSSRVLFRSELDGGLTGNDDPYVAFFHDVPRPLAEEAMGKSRGESEAAYNSPWPLEALPAVPTRFVLCTEDRFFPAAFARRLVEERLGVAPEETASGHCVALRRPKALAHLLASSAKSRGASQDGCRVAATCLSIRSEPCGDRTVTQ